MNHSPDDGIIRITKEETQDGHVDDMLKRQMSLRGEAGVTREHGRRWWYQNWFVFMIVGTLGALTAWAILEPIYDDKTYFQGEIAEIETDQDGLSVLTNRASLDENAVLKLFTLGSITIREQKIYLDRHIREIRGDKVRKRFDPNTLKVGETVGVHIDMETGPDDELIPLAYYIVRDPPPQNPGRAEKTLEQLTSRSDVVGRVLFALVAGLIGVFIGSADGIICRLPRRALLCGALGLLVGLVGGFVASLFAGIVYGPLTMLAMKQSAPGGGLTTIGFTIQLFGRSFAWGLVGVAMGLGQGLALRSLRLLLYGLIGGVVGGLLGGLLFDPIAIFFVGPDNPSAHMSRLIGIGVIGAAVGAMIGIVELLARDAWLRMTQGPLMGKEFLIFKDVMNVGSSPRSDIYLFNDPLVAENHAILRAVGDACEIEARQSQHPVLVNSRSVTHARLRHGDTVQIGKTAFVFQQRKT